MSMQETGSSPKLALQSFYSPCHCVTNVLPVPSLCLVQAAQPALLYIVPSILGTTFLHAMARGEFKQVFNFSEVSEEGEEGEGKEQDGVDGKQTADGKKESKKLK